MSTLTEQTASNLRQRYDELLAEQPKLRIRDAALALQVSEAELVALDCGDSVTRLSVDNWSEFVKELKPLGRVMVLTRNEHCVHEKTGEYENIAAHGGKIGLVTGKVIDLRLFYDEWDLAFAVESKGRDGASLRSFQVFDAAGQAIHKVYLKNETGLDAYQAIVEKYRSIDQSTEQIVGSAPALEEDQPVSEATAKSFLDGWSQLKDTHDFYPLLGKHKVSRLQSMVLAEGRFTQKVSNDTAKRVLELASERGISIMVFVGNEGAIQIHTGPVNKIVGYGEWINVIDPDFNLHLKEPGIVSSWIVEKPTVDGVVHSLEIYDNQGRIIAQFFGARKPGIEERQDWRDLVAELKA
ncbi:hemin-degrading factor [Rubellicoccus peritrichatus]|uniref:ChuX/HutX family heme-like substrate-binding protein n=1 Tax=Rubellicoccus peritrichatus TaxID=3080537 RepID=A0AAQ3LC61_9BACT|nr:ChuX/HutX family heme-like substrate-binding protein [Puniceicoccus sp. CR14]WOO42642.1 ChuX/HutX family heme-like substrate-binding protein [Puniceicoccus sp. CR14]